MRQTANPLPGRLAQAALLLCVTALTLSLGYHLLHNSLPYDAFVRFKRPDAHLCYLSAEGNAPLLLSALTIVFTCVSFVSAVGEVISALDLRTKQASVWKHAARAGGYTAAGVACSLITVHLLGLGC